jgi:hypothetical protein
VTLISKGHTRYECPSIACVLVSFSTELRQGRASATVVAFMAIALLAGASLGTGIRGPAAEWLARRAMRAAALQHPLDTSLALARTLIGSWTVEGESPTQLTIFKADGSYTLSGTNGQWRVYGDILLARNSQNDHVAHLRVDVISPIQLRIHNGGQVFVLDKVASSDPSPCTSKVATERVVVRVDDGGQDAFVGSVYHKAGSAHGEELSFGGWGDQYRDYFLFALPDSLKAYVVSNAVFCVFATSIPPNDPYLQVGFVTEPWAAETLTWDTRPAYGNTTPLGRLQLGWNTVPMSRTVSDWILGEQRNLGFVLIPQNNDHANGAFASGRHSDQTKRPRLVLELHSRQ